MEPEAKAKIEELFAVSAEIQKLRAEINPTGSLAALLKVHAIVCSQPELSDSNKQLLKTIESSIEALIAE